MPFAIQLCLAMLAFLPACSLEPDDGGNGNVQITPDLTADVRILFIGNSLTYVNDLPAMVKALVTGAGLPNTQVAAIAFPDFGLEQHWEEGQARTAVAKDGWTHVIMQQGPSGLETSRVNLLQWSIAFADIIKAHGAIPGMYMVWPSTERFGDFDRVSESYRLAAEAIEGQLYPAGDAWRAAWRRNPGLALYGNDGFHPSNLGTYTAALSIVGVVYNRTPVGLPALGISAATATLLQESAAEAIAAVPVGDRRP
jgi:hypothetical protein